MKTTRNTLILALALLTGAMAQEPTQGLTMIGRLASVGVHANAQGKQQQYIVLQEKILFLLKEPAEGRLIQDAPVQITGEIKGWNPQTGVLLMEGTAQGPVH
jgi:hypothetical protein